MNLPNMIIVTNLIMWFCVLIMCVLIAIDIIKEAIRERDNSLLIYGILILIDTILFGFALVFLTCTIFN